jgi:hypothetical protein
MMTLFITTGFSALAQELNQWSPVQTIPGYHSETWPPILIADQNRTVHAFSSQWLGDVQAFSKRAIVYNRWSPETGWTEPVDILLSPLKNDARLTSAFLDQNGMMHVVFFGGDNTEANIYYSRALAASAGKVVAWSRPVLVAYDVLDPENAAVFADDAGNIGILFSGNEKGKGVYAIYSPEGGNDWSSPIQISTTSSSDMLINNLQIYQGASGNIHAVWNEITSGGQGRGIYYTTSKTGDPNWKDPINIASADSGFGTNTPAVIENNGDVFAFYNVNGSITMRRLLHDGESWSNPIQIFTRHVGVNGSLSPVIDGNNELHLFFGQRITGTPDIHGMWHSMWQGYYWTEPEAIVSGPAIADQVGRNAFDPFEAHATVSQGNVILVTWRSDPGLKGNGVWYSYKILDLPELPVVALPSIQETPAPEPTSEIFLSTPTHENLFVKQNYEPFESEATNPTRQAANPVKSILMGVVPTILLISGAIVIIKKYRR